MAFNMNHDNSALNVTDEYDILYKLVLVGDMGVGKTHLVQRYKTGQLPVGMPPTIGVEFVSKIVPLRNGQGTVRA